MGVGSSLEADDGQAATCLVERRARAASGVWTQRLEHTCSETAPGFPVGGRESVFCLPHALLLGERLPGRLRARSLESPGASWLVRGDDGGLPVAVPFSGLSRDYFRQQWRWQWLPLVLLDSRPVVWESGAQRRRGRGEGAGRQEEAPERTWPPEGSAHSWSPSPRQPPDPAGGSRARYSDTELRAGASRPTSAN